MGPGYRDINAFLRSVDLSAFNVGDTRPQLIRRIRELQPEASVRAIAEAIGVSKSTIARDVTDVPNGTPEAPNGPPVARDDSATVPNGTPIEPDEADVEDLPAFLDGEDSNRANTDSVG